MDTIGEIMEKEALCQALKPYNYVSFDVFDTLIFRTVTKYQTIFEIVSLKYSELYGEYITDFAKARIKAEQEARYFRKGKEINMDMIYERLYYDSEKKERLRHLEEQCEIQNIVPNALMIDILVWCKEQNKQIIITTDMYLPRSVFEAIMQKINAEYDYLFISGEEGVTKRSGKLFSIVLERLGISGQELVHIGDDHKNDIKKPLEYGIRSILRIQNKIIKPTYVRSSVTDVIQDHFYNFILRKNQNHLNRSCDYNVGYSVIGPLMFEFCNWIHEVKQEQNIDSLLFVAREGYFIKQCYDLMFHEQTDYIRLNRNLLRLPLLKLSNPIKRFVDYLPECELFSWKEIFNMLLVSNHQEVSKTIQSHIPTFDYDIDIRKGDLVDGQYDNILLQLFYIQKDMIEEQSRLLEQYLDEKNIFGQKVGLVNNSLNGSGQAMLENYLSQHNLKFDLQGIQFVKKDKCIKRLGERCRAWITENNIPFFSSYMFESNSLLLEHLLFEPKGTSLYFKSVGNTFDVVCEQSRAEKDDFDFIREIQRNALEFIKDYRNNLNLKLKMQSFHTYMNFITRPFINDAIKMCRLNDDDINGDVYISDCSIPLSYWQIVKGRIPKSIKWVEGYLVAKNSPLVYRYTYRVRMALRCYRQSRFYLVRDIKRMFNHLFQ